MISVYFISKHITFSVQNKLSQYCLYKIYQFVPVSQFLQVAITKTKQNYRLSSLNNKYLFLNILEAGKYKIWRLKFQSLARSLLLVHKLPFSHCVFTWQKGEGCTRHLFYQGTYPIHEGHTLRTQSLPKAPLPVTITLSQDFNI